MSIIFECPNCRKTYETGEHLAGKGMRCRDCQAVIRVPDLAAPAPPVAPRRPVGPPAAPAVPRPAPAFAPPEDDDDDLPYAVAEIDDEEDEPPPRPVPAPVVVPRPVPAVAPTPTPAARPPQADGRPAPLPRMSFGPPPAHGAPAAAVGPVASPARREPRAPERREEPERGDAGQMVKLGAAGLFALVALLAVARVFLMGSGGGEEEEQTIILDAGPDFGSAAAPRPAASPAVSRSPSPAAPPTPALPPRAGAPFASGFLAGPAGLPAFPEVGKGFEVAPGVTWRKIRLTPARPPIGDPPPGSEMTLWLYLPAGEHAAGSLPCILIAPAGSTLVTGNGWYEPGTPPSAPTDPPKGDEGRHPEHLPYARAGFAVLGYELDGAVPENATEAQFVSGVRRFLAARAGLENAHVAMEYLKARVPQVDPKRIYAAGHSSAATTALLVAANEPGIAGCVAFAPCVDLMGRFQRATGDAEATIRDLERGVPGARALFTTYAPIENLGRIACPVFLLHAEDDANVPIADSRLVVERCRPGQVAMVNVAAGGHYDPMIRGGIDRAIQWLKEQGARPVPPGAPAGPAPAGGQAEAIPGF